jgi:hypothetical protein
VTGPHLPSAPIHRCRVAFWPILLSYPESHAGQSNRGAYRHFMSMPFDAPCFTPEFFFDAGVLNAIRGVMGERVVAGQWVCDVPLRGSQYQELHAGYRRLLFAEAPGLLLPPCVLVVSFGLIRITPAHGPIAIAPGTHRMPRDEALRGDVLMRHPRALHRGTPNTTGIPRGVWLSLTPEQRSLMRFPVEDRASDLNQVGHD